MNEYENFIDEFLRLKESYRDRVFSCYEWDVDYLLMNETVSVNKFNLNI